MSGNFAIKGGGGGGRTPNGKCHLKFPFWFSAPFPKIPMRDYASMGLLEGPHFSVSLCKCTCSFACLSWNLRGTILFVACLCPSSESVETSPGTTWLKSTYLALLASSYSDISYTCTKSYVPYMLFTKCCSCCCLLTDNVLEKILRLLKEKYIEIPSTKKSLEIRFWIWKIPTAHKAVLSCPACCLPPTFCVLLPQVRNYATRVSHIASQIFFTLESRGELKAVNLVEP